MRGNSWFKVQSYFCVMMKRYEDLLWYRESYSEIGPKTEADILRARGIEDEYGWNVKEMQATDDRLLTGFYYGCKGMATHGFMLMDSNDETLVECCPSISDHLKGKVEMPMSKQEVLWDF